MTLTAWCPDSPCAGTQLALGETGSGKTVSGILPVLGSIIAPENRMVGCTLVIDPKHEIRQVIGQQAHPGITVHDVDVECERRPVLNLMDGYGASLGPALDDGQYLEAARQILIRSASLSPLSAARAPDRQPRGRPRCLLGRGRRPSGPDRPGADAADSGESTAHFRK